MTIPDGAEPTPPGYCHNCGHSPDDERGMWRVIHVIGQSDATACGYDYGAHPRDPADIVYKAVQGILQDVLGYKDGPGMDPALADRMRALVDRTVTTWTRRETRP